MDNITRELPSPLIEPPPLDPTLFLPEKYELEFLRNSIGEKEDEMKQRILEVQAEAYQEYPYPCIRLFHFVALMMCQNPAYNDILEAVKSTSLDIWPIFLDLGCCMGTDVRKLVKDGYPAEGIIGCDIRESYITLGYKLYKDSPSSLPIHFIMGDIFELPISSEFPVSNHPLSAVTFLEELRGRVTYIYIGALFHIFDEDTQYALASRLACLVSRKGTNIIFGRHQGKPEEGIIDGLLGRLRYGHSPASWKKMWERVFRELDGDDSMIDKLEVKAKFAVTAFSHDVDKEHHQLTWSVHVQ